MLAQRITAGLATIHSISGERDAAEIDSMPGKS